MLQLCTFHYYVFQKQNDAKLSRDKGRKQTLRGTIEKWVRKNFLRRQYPVKDVIFIFSSSVDFFFFQCWPLVWGLAGRNMVIVKPKRCGHPCVIPDPVRAFCVCGCVWPGWGQWVKISSSVFAWMSRRSVCTTKNKIAVVCDFFWSKFCRRETQERPG